MRAVFLASKLPSTAVASWAASLQTSGASVRHIVAWSGADEVSRRQSGGGACNVDTFLLGPGVSLESHVAQFCSGGGSGSGDGLLLVSLQDPAGDALPRGGVVLLVWQPQVPQDIVQACLQVPASLADTANVRGLLLVDASPSLTLSVTHKALEGAGLQALARKPTVLAPRTAQVLLQLSDALPSPPPPAAALLGPSLASPGGVRIAVARDDVFGPCFHENLLLLQQSGAQLVFFSPLYDSAVPAGATCLYLSSGPLEPERWQQLAANRPLLAAVRAFCDAGGLLFAEGAGLLYLSRTVDLNEDEGGNKSCVYDMASVLPFKTRLLAEPQAASVQLLVGSGNPLLPAGSRPRGYLSAQASIVMVEERQLHSLFLGQTHGSGGKGSPGPHLTTTYEVSVVPERAVAAASTAHPAALGTIPGKAGGPAGPPASPEGYTLHNVLASSCLVFLPSDPGMVAHWLRRCASLDPAALAAGMAQHLGGVAAGAPTASKLGHLSGISGSAAASRAGSRRQSIQDVSALGAAYASNGSISSVSSHATVPPGLVAAGHHNHHLQGSWQLLHNSQSNNNHHLQGAQHRAPHLVPQPYAAECADPRQTQQQLQQQLHHHHHLLLQGASCGAGPACSGQCAASGRPPSNLSHSSSATGTSSLGLVQPPRRSLCGPTGLPQDGGGAKAVSACCRSPNPNPRCASPHLTPLPPSPHPGYPPACWPDGPSESPGLLSCVPEDRQSLQERAGFLQGVRSSAVSPALQPTAVTPGGGAARLKLDTLDRLDTASDALSIPPGSPSWLDDVTEASSDGAQHPASAAAAAVKAAERIESPYPWDGSTDDSGGGLLGPHAGLMHHAASAGSLGSYTLYGPAGSACSLVELPYQRGGQVGGRLGEAGAVGWVVGGGAVGGLHGGPGAQWSPGMAPAGARHGSVMVLGPMGPAGPVGQGGVVCCAPGACEALVAMGLANRLVGIGSECDYPADVCASRRAVMTWVPVEEAPQGPAARGIRVVMPGGTLGGSAAGAAAGGQVTGGAAVSGRAGRPSGERLGVRGGGLGGGGRALVVDELAMRQEVPSVCVLPDPSELSEVERAQMEQALVETGLIDSRGGPAGACCVMTSSCRTLVDVMDLVVDLGAALEEPHAASMLLERLQARMRRVVAAAAAAAGPARPPSALLSGVAAPPAGAGPAKCPRVLVLKSLQPLVEAGRWVPEMLALVGASSCMALPGGPDVTLTWQELRELAAPDVLIILTSPGSGLADPRAGGGAAGPAGGQAKGASADGLHEQLAALASQQGWWCLPAVRVSQVYVIQSSYFVRAGPRLVDGVELLARLLLPGQYSSSRKLPSGSVMRLSLAAGQRCRATLLPSYFAPLAFG